MTAQSTSGRKRVVFHIGMPKCGSTYLQRLIFPNLPGVHYETTGGGQVGLGSIADKLRSLDDIVAAASENIVLMSAESLCGHPADKATYTEFGEFLPHIPDRYDVCVIVVVRRQDSFVDSMYRHHVRKGGILDLAEFFSVTNENQIVATKVGDGSLHHSYCDYSRFLSYLNARGSQSIVTLTFIPFELMQTDLTAFVHRVAQAVGVTEHNDIPNVFVNRGPSMPEFAIRKKLNKINAIKPGLAARVYRKLLVLALRASMYFANFYYMPVVLLSESERRQILEHYREGNNRVASLCAKDLYALGYC